ncbi:hypothetical protein ACWGGS_12580 [Streptomyces decoyicus]
MTYLFLCQDRRAAEAGAAGAGSVVQGLVGALDDEFADAAREGGEEVDDESAARRGGVECFVKRSVKPCRCFMERSEADAALA